MSGSSCCVYGCLQPAITWFNLIPIGPLGGESLVSSERVVGKAVDSSYVVQEVPNAELPSEIESFLNSDYYICWL